MYWEHRITPANFFSFLFPPFFFVQRRCCWLLWWATFSCTGNTASCTWCRCCASTCTLGTTPIMCVVFPFPFSFSFLFSFIFVHSWHHAHHVRRFFVCFFFFLSCTFDNAPIACVSFLERGCVCMGMRMGMRMCMCMCICMCMCMCMCMYMCMCMCMCMYRHALDARQGPAQRCSQHAKHNDDMQ